MPRTLLLLIKLLSAGQLRPFRGILSKHSAAMRGKYSIGSGEGHPSWSQLIDKDAEELTRSCLLAKTNIAL